MELSNTVSKIISESGEAIKQVDKTMDLSVVSRPDDMVKNLFSLTLFSHMISYGSSVIKTYKDMVGGIIAKI